MFIICLTSKYYNLWSWFQRMRKLKQTNKMSAPLQEALEDMGIEWPIPRKKRNGEEILLTESVLSTKKMRSTVCDFFVNICCLFVITDSTIKHR